jgi:23S rRNA (uridine2552-2'-O)-methyltransferase
MFKYQDHYFKKAQEQWFKARSAFKLEEIQDKFHIFDKNTKTILDIWCAPWSWIQYAVAQSQENKIQDYKIIWFDILDIKVKLPNVFTYKQDISDQAKVKEILEQNWVEKIDLIQSDMAPFTIWVKDIDAIRSFGLIEQTLRIYDQYLKSDGKFVIKLFMWPWFDQFVLDMKKKYGWTKIKLFKPQSSRKESKEIFIIKI